MKEPVSSIFYQMEVVVDLKEQLILFVLSKISCLIDESPPFSSYLFL